MIAPRRERQCGRIRLDSEIRVTKSHVGMIRKLPDGVGSLSRVFSKDVGKPGLSFWKRHSQLSVFPEDGLRQRDTRCQDKLCKQHEWFTAHKQSFKTRSRGKEKWASGRFSTSDRLLFPTGTRNIFYFSKNPTRAIVRVQLPG